MLLKIERIKINIPKKKGIRDNLNGFTPAVFIGKISLFADRLENVNSTEDNMAIGNINELRDGIIKKIILISEINGIFPETTLSIKSAILTIIKNRIKTKWEKIYEIIRFLIMYLSIIFIGVFLL